MCSDRMTLLSNRHTQLALDKPGQILVSVVKAGSMTQELRFPLYWTLLCYNSEHDVQIQDQGEEGEGQEEKPRGKGYS